MIKNRKFAAILTAVMLSAAEVCSFAMPAVTSAMEITENNGSEQETTAEVPAEEEQKEDESLSEQEDETPAVHDAEKEEASKKEWTSAGDGCDIEVTGMFADKVYCEIDTPEKEAVEDAVDENMEVLCSGKIAFTDKDGEEAFPEDEISVSITGETVDAAKNEGREIYVCILTDEGETEEIDTEQTDEKTVFKAYGSCVFMVTAEKEEEQPEEEQEAEESEETPVDNEEDISAEETEEEETEESEDTTKETEPAEDTEPEEPVPEENTTAESAAKEETVYEEASTKNGAATGETEKTEEERRIVIQETDDEELHTILTKSTDVAEISLKSSEENTAVKELDGITSEEGLIVSYAFSVKDDKKDAKNVRKMKSAARTEDNGQGKTLQAEIALSENADLSQAESVCLYSIKDGKLCEPVSDSLTHDVKTCDIPGNAEGIAVVLDTGFRRKEFDIDAGTGQIGLSGIVPKGAEASAQDVTAETESPEKDRHILTAYDITITDGDNNYQPDEEKPINVTIQNPKIAADDNIEVWHIEDDGEMTQVYGVAATDGEVKFDAYGFSVYAVIDGPPPAEYDTEDVTTASELAENCETESFILSVHRLGSDIYFMNSVNTASSKYIIRTTGSISSAGEWIFEPTGIENQYRMYTEVEGVPNYITNPSGNYVNLTTDAGSACVFDVSEAGDNRFLIKLTGQNKWLQFSNGGGGFRFWTANDNAENCHIEVTYASSLPVHDDAYGLDGKTYGLLCYSDMLYGEALMAQEASDTTLESLRMRVRVPMNGEKGLYVANDQDMSFWTFKSLHNDYYTLSSVVNGERRYLKLEGNTLTLADEEDATPIQVVPGTGNYAGKILLTAHGSNITFNGTNAFRAATTVSEPSWLSLAEASDLTEDSFIIYSAQKVSVSDTENVRNGSKIIIYTRVWNAEKTQYDYYAVNHDGSLVPCYETSDSIEWVGDRLNTILWQFTEYYNEETGEPNYYYELKNPYENKFLAPQIGNSQILSENTIGLNLNGRRYGDYYTKIVAWDDPYYSYASLKANGTDTRLETCPMAQGADFYFAIMQNAPDDDEIPTEIPTIDNNEHGITMRMVNFTSNAKQNTVLGSKAGGLNAPPTQGLLSTSLGNDGYPEATLTNRSLEELFGEAVEVNHLFASSIYNGTGYFSYDSAQNFAALKENGDFKVYRELGTADVADRPSLKHGQFMPYNDLEPGVYASVNGENLYDALMQPLPESDPRKYEKMYLVDDPDYYFGMELTASFVQTPSGHDAWGHDIVYRFSGDDDFWMYVDGELIIDLGGIHSALSGDVNFKTGEIVVNGAATNLRAVFESHYRSGHPDATNAQVQAYLDEIFEPGENVFRDYSTHTMKIYYMERGAGASNLDMQFNISSVNQGNVQLSKVISGTDKEDYQFAEYPFQVWYRINESEPFRRLTNKSGDEYNVKHINSNIPADYKAAYTPAGGTTVYNDVFFIKAGDTVAITIPDETLEYYIVECGISSDVYDAVHVNDVEVTGTPTGDGNRKDYRTTTTSVIERRRVVYDNHVNENAMRTLTVTKNLYEADGTTPITDDPTGFDFRLYLGNENETDLSTAAFQDYHVKDSQNRYCRWNAQLQRFESIGETVYENLTPAQLEQVTFQTSINGTIAKIPAGHKIEMRDLLVGTKFRIEEKTGELPSGYSLIGYERDANSYIIEEGDTENSGTIRDNQSPSVEVNNKRGFGITANKVWSDAAFMEDYDDVYFAVYADGVLIPDSVRCIRYPAVSTYYYFDSLLSGTDFDDYRIVEVELTGDVIVANDGTVTGYSSVTPLAEGDPITVEATSRETHERDSYEYRVSYEMGTPEGSAGNARTDVVKNARHGIRLVKKNWAGTTPLSGASFTLTDSSGDTVGSETFVSGQDGVIADAYLKPGEVYTLTETKSPEGYTALEGAVKFSVGTDGVITVTQGDPACYTVSQETQESPATITIKDRPFELKVVKTDGQTNLPLGGAHFSLHREVTVGDETGMVRDPIPGYEDLVSSETDGVVPGVDETLPAGFYYLKEKSAPGNYTGLETPFRFGIDEKGNVTLTPHDDVSLNSGLLQDGTKSWTLAVKNVATARLTIRKQIRGNMGNRARTFTFTLVSVEGEEAGTMYPWEKDGVSGEISTTGGNNTFVLGNDDSIVICLPPGKQILLREDNGLYTTTWKLDSNEATTGNSKTLELAEDATLLVTNTLSGFVPTGVAAGFGTTVCTLLAALAAYLLAGKPRLKKSRKCKEPEES